VNDGKILYLDCFSGASGDMLLGALLDAGLPLEAVKETLASVPLGGYDLKVEAQVRHGLQGTQFRVVPTDDAQPIRFLRDVDDLLDSSDLSASVRDPSKAAFRRLAAAEARVHGVSMDEIHFHEVGAVDTVVDIVGFVSGLEALGVASVHASSLPLGDGFIETAHGKLPLPAPATLEILAEVGAPTRPAGISAEMVTPTGAALLAEMAGFSRPSMQVEAVGYGFGTRELPWANGLRAWLGDPQTSSLQVDDLIVLECNLDDVTGENLGYVLEELLKAGALDVWFTPIQMKKNRPAMQLSALSTPAEAEALTARILRETPTLGVRAGRVERRCAGRRMDEVTTPWGKVRVKYKILGEEVVAASPEYEDCVRLARANDVPLMDVYGAARSAANDR
jgi:uncharacterized protein (TIGR00299 family) protein